MTKNAHVNEHVHRRPRKKDFEGKTVKRFQRTADNIWRIWFTDDTAFAIQTEIAGAGTGLGVPFMELCDICVKD
jgi:hypothetical protein